MFMGIDDMRLRDAGGYDTAFEILQQPTTLHKVYKNISEREEEIQTFKQKLGEHYTVLLLGAGSSEFAASAVYYAIKK